MAIKEVTLKESMNKIVHTIMPLDEEKNRFVSLLTHYLNTLINNQNESEEYQKNLLKDFLSQVLPNNYINTYDRIDLAIHNGAASKSAPGVIFECKRLNNNSEMMSKRNLNTKAFQEIIYYYLKERIIKHNVEIKKCIVTNGLSWFIIDSKDLEKHFYKNKELLKYFEKFQKKQLSNQTTEFFYEEIISPAINQAINKGIAITHFDFSDTFTNCKSKIEIQKSKINLLYRFFSAENLLNKELFLDPNKLNKNFYDELLYIMGLEEIKTGNTKIISRLPKGKRQRLSFVENIIERLENNDVPCDKHEDIALQLTVIWFNRILFLKLLESQLILFNKSLQYKFLSFDKIKNFEDLYDLFFAVLAKKETERNEYMSDRFGFIPYLNSSLFEPTALELSTHGLSIDRLREGKINIFAKTALLGSDKKRKKGDLNIIQYLFEFLDSYDFSTSIQNKNKGKNTLINASVLGLIFEKINGYKDGAFFTPGSITQYMSKKSIRMTVVGKINKLLAWNCKTIDDIKIHIRDVDHARKVSDVIDSIRICDPAVGSGHFLVAALNELIALKSELNSLFDIEGKPIGHLIQCHVVNDELIVQDLYGNNFVYEPNNRVSEQIQKTLFNEKRKILENNLFGVDINPSSANICRLRLWIELLKSAYYYVDDSQLGERILTTLPNIDINIKVGDSLLHKFGFKDRFDMRKGFLKEYLSLVKTYKQTNNKQLKSSILEKISTIKKSFDDTATSPELSRLKKLNKKLVDASQFNLFGDNKNDEQKFKDISKQLDLAEKAYQEKLRNPLYSNGLEWRMEFPELLDEDGKFLGFDLVIGNPPYIFARNQSFDEEMKQYYLKNYEVSEYQANTYTLFMELAYKILADGGCFSFIIPNNFLTIQSNKKIREFILKNTGSVVLINSLDKIFEDANVDNCILFFKKEPPNSIEVLELKNEEFNFIDQVDASFWENEDVLSISKVKYKNLVEVYNKVNIVQSIENSNIAEVRTGIKAYQIGKGKPKQVLADKENRVYHSREKLDSSYRPYLEGADVSRYKLHWSGEYISYGEQLAEPRFSVDFTSPRILVRQIPAFSKYAIHATYIETDAINDLNSMIITNIMVNPYYLLGVLNSKLITIWFLIKFDKFQRRIFPQFKVNELGEFPTPLASSEEQTIISRLVIAMIDENKKTEPDMNMLDSLNKQIDDLVMSLFDLDDKEKRLVEEFEIF
ncbi:TaqI-like C-terminal specificity domain-containing protein [Gemella sanguinis]|uniref:DUF7149 domain-containing protein n=1 Tax=Gemella sanguinis TaxID=84135 RepID=UPI0026EAFBA7|nr:TaqI-like C-terminal specificity domain-containing protein [Gemella sanguinis]